MGWGWGATRRCVVEEGAFMAAVQQSPWQPAQLPKIAYGKGSYLFDSDGKRYIDG